MRAAWVALVAGIGLGLAVVAAVPAPTDELGPVARALALDRGPELDRRRAAAVADATGRCLARHGIAAHPVADPAPVIPDAELDPVAWAERWGFGITTASGWSSAIASEPTSFAPMDTSPVVAACRDEASTAVYGLRDRLLSPLRPALEALGMTIDADPATISANAAWTACAAGAIRAADPRLPTPTQPGRLELLRAWFAARAVPVPDPAIVALERRVATAVARCDLDALTARRRAAEPHERAFVRDHQAELRRIAAEIREAEAAYPAAEP